MKELHHWFERNRRDFPWRRDKTPYRVWVSEVMLQQTRAAVVVPYFERWMERFPNVEALAAARLEEVIKAWEGLGYYSRARNLHAGAKEIVERFGGEIPEGREALESIRGLGPYTVGAILSFGFQKRAAAVDGNVVRVLARYFLIEENVGKSAVKRQIGEKAEQLLDEKEPWVTSEALIELGATHCAPRPRCEGCPLQSGCKAFREKKAEVLPIKSGESKTVELNRAVYWIEAEGKVLVRKGEAGRVMADLYEFPYVEGKREGACLGFKKWRVVKRLPEVSHTFTRFKAHLRPFMVRAELRDVEGHMWIEKERLAELPFSSGHRKILKVAILKENALTS